MKKTLSRIIGGRIKRFRREQKLSQEELALRSGLSANYVGIIERGDKCPTIEALYKIASGLNVPLYKLVDLDDEIDKKQQNTTDSSYEKIANELNALYKLAGLDYEIDKKQRNTTGSFYEDKKITKFVEEVEDSLYTIYDMDKVMDAIRLILEIAKGGL